MARILVVDDHEAMRTLCREELAEDGHSVETATTENEVFSLVVRGRTDLVVLELAVDQMSGLAIFNELRRRVPEIPIVVHTVYPEFQREFTIWSAAAFIVKSSDLGTLRAEVQRVLQSRPVLRETA